MRKTKGHQRPFSPPLKRRQLGNSASATRHVLYLLYHHRAETRVIVIGMIRNAPRLSQTFEARATASFFAPRRLDAVRRAACQECNRHRAKGARSAPGRALQAQPRGRRAGSSGRRVRVTHRHWHLRWSFHLRHAYWRRRSGSSAHRTAPPRLWPGAPPAREAVVPRPVAGLRRSVRWRHRVRRGPNVNHLSLIHI